MNAMAFPYHKTVGADLELTVKVVPGPSRDRIVGLLGDALKIQLAAPPERGKANAALVRLLAARLGIPERQIAVVRGTSNPRKTIRIQGMTPDDVIRRLAPA